LLPYVQLAHLRLEGITVFARHSTCVLAILLLVALAGFAPIAQADVPAPGGAGPHMITTLAGNRKSVVITTFHDKGYFLGSNGLWTTDGTAAGTAIVFGGSGDPSYVQSPAGQIAVAGDRMFFTTYDTNAGRSQLWLSDGTAAGTQPVTDVAGIIVEMAPLQDTLVFVVEQFEQIQVCCYARPVPVRQLWKSDGTAVGTGVLKDTRTLGSPIAGSPSIQSGAASRAIIVYPKLISGLMVVGGAVMFAAYAPSTPNSGVLWTLQLWRTDGTPLGTTAVKDLFAVPAGLSGIVEFAVSKASNGVQYFQVLPYDMTIPTQSLWRTDGTSEGTLVVYVSPRYVVSDTADWHNQLLFLSVELDPTVSYPSATAGQVYQSNGNPQNTRLLFSSRDFITDQSYRFVNIFPASGGFFVTGYSFESGSPPRNDLWYSDGTREHTRLLFSTDAQLQVSMFADRAWLVVHDYATPFSDPSNTTALWISDGTTAGTQLVGTDPSVMWWEQPSQLGERMLVGALEQDPNGSYQLWEFLSGPEAYLATATTVGGAPGGRVGLPLRYGNLGTATGPLTLTATLPPGVTLVSDTLGTPAQVNGATLTWNLPALALVENRDASIELALPDRPYGTRLPVSFAIGQAGAMPDDTVTLDLMIAHHVFLPFSVR
jgi:ELWxxDGT repeat protein